MMTRKYFFLALWTFVVGGFGYVDTDSRDAKLLTRLLVGASSRLLESQNAVESLREQALSRQLRYADKAVGLRLN